MTRDEIAEFDENLLLLEPPYFDQAIMGVVTRINFAAVCYSSAKIVELLMSEQGMDEEAAYEWFEFNIAGAYMGEMTPVFL